MATITKSEAKQFLAKVPEPNNFRCHDDCVMSDLNELSKSLYSMSDDTYRFHANEMKNDFSNWINDVIGDRELANNLRKAKDRTHAAKIVSDRISFLSKRAL